MRETNKATVLWLLTSNAQTFTVSPLKGRQRARIESWGSSTAAKHKSLCGVLGGTLGILQGYKDRTRPLLTLPPAPLPPLPRRPYWLGWDRPHRHHFNLSSCERESGYPKRQLSIVWDPDHKPHHDWLRCGMKKHNHLALNLIRLREERAGVIRISSKEV